jgi:hypothetical protein
MMSDMTKFTVFYAGGDAAFDEGASYKIEANGVLQVIAADGERRIFSPAAWHSIIDRAPEKGSVDELG